MRSDEKFDSVRGVFDDAGPLVAVDHVLFEGDPGFITAVRLRFEARVVVIRANADDDTICVNGDGLLSTDSEVVAEVTTDEPWTGCVGRVVTWAWAMTNQQGYTDGVRIEFRGEGEATERIVELVVAASAIRLFRAASVR